jgi:hypothetical protein
MATYSIRTIWKRLAIATAVLAGLFATAVGWHRYEYPYDTLEQERDVLCCEIRQLPSRIAPPKGSSKADVEKVFGPPVRFSNGGMGPPFVTYSLGRSGVDLDVVFASAEKRRWHDSNAARRDGLGSDSYSQTDSVESVSASEPFSQDNEVMELAPIEIQVSRCRIAVHRLRAALAEYADRLSSAPWNHK